MLYRILARYWYPQEPSVLGLGNIVRASTVLQNCGTVWPNWPYLPPFPYEKRSPENLRKCLMYFDGFFQGSIEGSDTFACVQSDSSWYQRPKRVADGQRGSEVSRLRGQRTARQNHRSQEHLHRNTLLDGAGGEDITALFKLNPWPSKTDLFFQRLQRHHLTKFWV